MITREKLDEKYTRISVLFAASLPFILLGVYLGGLVGSWQWQTGISAAALVSGLAIYIFVKRRPVRICVIISQGLALGCAVGIYYSGAKIAPDYLIMSATVAGLIAVIAFLLRLFIYKKLFLALSMLVSIGLIISFSILFKTNRQLYPFFLFMSIFLLLTQITLFFSLYKTSAENVVIISYGSTILILIILALLVLSEGELASGLGEGLVESVGESVGEGIAESVGGAAPRRRR